MSAAFSPPPPPFQAHASQPNAGQSIPNTGGIGVVAESMALYQQLTNVIQLRESNIQAYHPQQIAPGGLPQVSLWVVGLSQVAQRPNWLNPLLQSSAPVLVVLPHWHDEAAVALFDANVTDILIAPVPNVYLATRVLKALEADDDRQQLAQAHRVLASHQLCNTQGIWRHDCWPALVEPFLTPNGGTQESLSVVIWQLDKMSPQTADLLRSQLVSLCRGEDIVCTTQHGQLATLLPYTNAAACQGFLQRVGNTVPGVYSHHAHCQTFAMGPHAGQQLQQLLG